MPLYEFKCLECEEFFEILLMSKEEEVELKCPKCNSPELERVLSTTNFAMGPAGQGGGVRSETRRCSSGSCTTYEIPGPNG